MSDQPYSVHDLGDKPPKEAIPFWVAMRDLPVGKTLFLPRLPGDSMSMTQTRALHANDRSRRRPGHRARTQQDHRLDGVWVWWEEREVMR